MGWGEEGVTEEEGDVCSELWQRVGVNVGDQGWGRRTGVIGDRPHLGWHPHGPVFALRGFSPGNPFQPSSLGRASCYSQGGVQIPPTAGSHWDQGSEGPEALCPRDPGFSLL